MLGIFDLMVVWVVGVWWGLRVEAGAGWVGDLVVGVRAGGLGLGFVMAV